ncbi:MAG TPA: DUF998 domain-containing protein [Anaerolineales bacterium]|nr:DUF998 domain-containing protein [Anaerolineales bacterium]
MQTLEARHTAARMLLTCGTIAGPLYVALGALQMLIRPGFDPARNDLSLLSNGNLGWIQVANFIAAGVLVIAGAAGVRQVLHGGPGGSWGPVLPGLYGLGLMGGGLFSADPMNGFPPGTPAGAPVDPTVHGFMHILSGAIGFLGLGAACSVFARRFAALGQRGWAACSIITGAVFLAAFFGIAMGSQQGGATLVFVTVAFTIAVLLAWSWVSLIAAKFSRGLSNGGQA